MIIMLSLWEGAGGSRFSPFHLAGKISEAPEKPKVTEKGQWEFSVLVFQGLGWMRCRVQRQAGHEDAGKVGLMHK